MSQLAQWLNVAGANIQECFLNKNSAGSSMCTIVVPNMDEARISLTAAGLTLEGEQEDDFGKITKISDPDWNEITLAESPKTLHSKV